METQNQNNDITLKCEKCGNSSFMLNERVFGGNKHVAAVCTECYAHLKFVPQSPKPVTATGEKSRRPITPDTLVNFGKHKGTPWKDVPASYLKWLAENSSVEDFRNAAKNLLK